jgi:hypothetical protein
MVRRRSTVRFRKGAPSSWILLEHVTGYPVAQEWHLSATQHVAWAASWLTSCRWAGTTERIWCREQVRRLSDCALARRGTNVARQGGRGCWSVSRGGGPGRKLPAGWCDLAGAEPRTGNGQTCSEPATKGFGRRGCGTCPDLWCTARVADSLASEPLGLFLRPGSFSVPAARQFDG